MNKVHATVIALILGVSGALGIAAATQTTGLRAPAASGVSDAAVAARQKQLDKVERQIARARRDVGESRQTDRPADRYTLI